MRRIIWLMIALALLLCGCAREETSKISFDGAATLPIEEVDALPMLEFSETGAIPSPSGFTAAEEGVFVVEERDSSPYSLIHFSDNRTGEIYPICTRINCTHDTEDCGAAVLRDWFYGLHCDGSYLYYVASQEGTVSDCLFRQKIDGTERTVVFQLNQKAPNQQAMAACISSTVYDGGMVYFVLEGTYFNEEVGDVERDTKIAMGDLTTGAVRIVPISFGGENKWLELKGKYGRYLVGQYREQTGFITETYRITYFLMDVDTQEIIFLCEDSYGDMPPMVSTDFSADSGILIFDNRIVDLERGRVYRLNDERIESLWVLDEYWIIRDSQGQRLVQNIATGEQRSWPENTEGFSLIDYANHISLDDYLVMIRGELTPARISKEDFWAGKPELVRFPDWVFLH